MALKTNSKKARENIRASIIDDCIYYFEVDGDDYTGCTPVTDVMRDLRDRHFDMVERKLGDRAILRYDMQGLGLGDMVHARKHLQEWLEETDEEASRFVNTQCEELYLNLYDREFFWLMDKERSA